MLAYARWWQTMRVARSCRAGVRATMSWKPEVDGIEERRRLAKELGGAASVERQHALGRLTIRERIAAFADTDSVREQGSIPGHPALDGPG